MEYDPQYDQASLPEFTHIVTKPFLQTAKRDPDYVEIYPEHFHKWTFPFLFAFLNEFAEPWVKYKRSQHRSKRNQILVLKWWNPDEEAIIKVMILKEWKIIVYANLYGLLRSQSWIRQDFTELTNHDDRNRETQKRILRTFLRWSLHFETTRDGTNWIFQQSSFVPLDRNDYSPLVLRLTKQLIRARLPQDPNTVFLFVLDRMFSIHRTPTPAHTFQSFARSVPGYLHFNLIIRRPGDQFEPFHSEVADYSIVSGYYLTPWAKSIIQDNPIDGIVLDTTWTVMREYVTALLMAVFYNVGIPIAFAWGPAETRELYEMFYGGFQKLFQINLSDFVLESDQGSALQSIAGEYHVKRHLLCLRHFLASLKTKKHSFEVGNLVKARTREEFELLKALYDLDLANIEDDREISQYARLLGKAGLGIVDRSIVILDQDRWNQVSIWRRVETWNMPTTTNCQEAMNGHLNERTTRRNPFWQSMFLLSSMMFHKTQSFRIHALQNFNNTVKRVKRRAKHVPENVMMRECEYFQTSIEHCNCSETILEAKMFRTQIPCSHQTALLLRQGNSVKTNLSETAQLALNASIDHLDFTQSVLQRDAIALDEQHTRGLKTFAQKQIKRFSHAKDKEKISRYVGEHFAIGETFALGIPVSVLELISAGIREFSKK
jgi:hypothetical protein